MPIDFPPLRFLEKGEAIRYKSYYKNEYQNGLSKVREELAKSICAEVSLLKNEDGDSPTPEKEGGNNSEEASSTTTTTTSPNLIRIHKKKAVPSPKINGNVLKVGN